MGLNSKRNSLFPGSKPMDKPETILKELRIDWECVCSEDFNPLHLSLKLDRDSTLASNFREMFYRLEFAMEEVISKNFRGFSTSIGTYSIITNSNRNLLAHLQSVTALSSKQGASSGSICDCIKSLQESMKEIEQECKKKTINDIKRSICAEIMKVKQLVYEFDTIDNLYKKSSAIIRSLDMIDKTSYIKIKGVEEYRDGLYEKYKGLVQEVNQKIAEYVFGDEQEKLQYYKCVVILGSLNELETFFREQFREKLYEAIEGSVLSEYQSGAVTLKQLCKSVSSKIDSVSRNMQVLIKNTNKRFETESGKNFFGRETTPFKFCIDNEFVTRVINTELDLFISRYTQNAQDLAGEFDVDCIVDDLDYSSIYDPSLHISAMLSSGQMAGETAYGEYTLITAPKLDVTLYFLKYIKTPAIRSYLNERISGEYTASRLEDAIQKLDLFFGVDPLELDSSSLKLRVFDRAMGVFSSSDTPEHRSVVKSHLNKRLHGTFKRVFNDLFKSEMIQSSCEETETHTEVPDSFKEKLATSSISKKDLFLNAEKYRVIICIINTLKEFDNFLCTKESSSIYTLYLVAFKCQLQLEFIYFFDLFFRQGSHRMYMRKMVRIPRLIYSISKDNKYFYGLYSAILHYIMTNIPSIGANSRESLQLFVKNLNILDEIIGEVEHAGSLKDAYTLFARVLEGTASDKQGMMLQQRIK